MKTLKQTLKKPLQHNKKNLYTNLQEAIQNYATPLNKPLKNNYTKTCKSQQTFNKNYTKP